MKNYSLYCKFCNRQSRLKVIQLKAIQGPPAALRDSIETATVLWMWLIPQKAHPKSLPHQKKKVCFPESLDSSQCPLPSARAKYFWTLIKRLVNWIKYLRAEDDTVVSALSSLLCNKKENYFLLYEFILMWIININFRKKSTTNQWRLQWTWPHL